MRVQKGGGGGGKQEMMGPTQEDLKTDGALEELVKYRKVTGRE